MGYRVSTVGHIDVKPALNDEEYEYLTAFAESRRWSRSQGPLWVPSSPFSFGEDEDEVAATTDEVNQPPGGQPGLWCPWIPGCRGSCLQIRDDGTDGKNYGIVPWLQYLIDTFLRPDAAAKGKAEFETFTFDHVVSGVIAAHRSDNGELWLVRAKDNQVRHDTLRPGDPYDWLDERSA